MQTTETAIITPVLTGDDLCISLFRICGTGKPCEPCETGKPGEGPCVNPCVSSVTNGGLILMMLVILWCIKLLVIIGLFIVVLDRRKGEAVPECRR